MANPETPTNIRTQSPYSCAGETQQDVPLDPLDPLDLIINTLNIIEEEMELPLGQYADLGRHYLGMRGTARVIARSS